MDARSKANFINSVAGGQEIVCTNCGAKNKADSKFCIACGKEFTTARKENKTPAFAAVKETETTCVEKAEETPNTKPVKYEEPVSVFAQGLPAWNLEPPQVMVRRH